MVASMVVVSACRAPDKEGPPQKSASACLHAGSIHHARRELSGGTALLVLKRLGCDACPASLGPGAPPGAPCNAASVCAEVCCECAGLDSRFTARVCHAGLCEDGAEACQAAQGVQHVCG